MAHGLTEIVVPISPMDAVAAIIVHGIGNIRQVVISTKRF